MPGSLLALILCFLLATPTLADARTDFRINNLSDSAHSTPRIAVGPGGSFAVVWRQSQNGFGDILLQRFANSGYPIEENLVLNGDLGNFQQTQPSLAGAFNGSFVGTWLDYRTATQPTDPQIYLQTFGDTGSIVSPNRLLTTTVASRSAPDIALLPSGAGIVVWSEYRNSIFGIYGQLIAADGSLVGTSFRISDLVDTASQAPRVAASARGWYIVVWESKRYGNSDIFAQRLSSAGLRIGNSIRVNNDAGGTIQRAPDVAVDGLGRFTVVWEDSRTAATAPDIYAARFDTTLLPLNINYRVNDGTTASRSQKYPAIAADRMGNVAIVYAEQIGTYWDILGRMIDVDGVARGDFVGSTVTDSSQIYPDVALDGAYRYVVWADNRLNRNFDIYGSITRYNDRMLYAAPLALNYLMRQGGPSPAAQWVTLTHAGYNSIPFEAPPHSDWLTVTPTGGSTPDSIAISIGSTTLPHGSYDGAIQIIDPLTADSSIVISVHLEVNAAALALSADTVALDIPVGYDTVVYRGVTVSNSGQGSLSWTAVESDDWLSLSPTQGSAPAELQFAVDGRSLPTGEYVSVVAVDAGYAANSPDSVVVVLRVRDDLPIIAVTPSTISASIVGTEPYDTAITVANLGGGTLDWNVTGVPAWLDASPVSGSGPGGVALSVVTSGLSEGVNTATLIISDPAAFNGSARTQVSITYDPPMVDTFTVEQTVVAPGTEGQFGITARINNSLTHVELPLKYDPAMMTIDSIRFGSNLPLTMDRYSRIEPSAGAFLLRLDRTPPDIAMPPGEYDLADVYFTAGSFQGPVVIDTVDQDTLSPLVVTLGGGELIPTVLGALIIIDQATDIDEPDDVSGVPVALFQNYPNPFNSTTVVNFGLPVKTMVKLEVFNVLGRRVAVLAEGSQGPGNHQVTWTGVDESGREVPSGVYFYRLQTPDTALVAKMILVK